MSRFIGQRKPMKALFPTAQTTFTESFGTVFTHTSARAFYGKQFYLFHNASL
jgi:hypothetical protein